MCGVDLILLGDRTNGTARVAQSDHMAGNILAYQAFCADHCIGSDRYAGKDRDIGADPYVVADRDRKCDLEPAVSFLWIERVVCGIHSAVWTDENVLADRDRAAIHQVRVPVDEGALADRDPVTVIYGERTDDRYILCTSRQKLLLDLLFCQLIKRIGLVVQKTKMLCFKSHLEKVGIKVGLTSSHG